MKLRTLTVIVALMSVVGIVGVSAFTTATVARDASLDVATDDNGIIALNDGNVDGAAITGDTLEINGEKTGEPGLNTEAEFTFGDNASAPEAVNEHAFTITNDDDVQHTFNFSFTTTPTDAMTIDVAHDSDDDGTVDTVRTVDSTDENLLFASGETAYVVVYVDTSGVTPGTDAISGTLTISAS